MAEATEHHDDHGHGLAHVAAPKVLLATGGTLLLLTLVTVISSKIDFGGSSINLAIAMVIAVTKATLVVLFFMHMTEAPGANRLVFSVSLVFTIVMMVGVFGDLLTRNPMTLPTGSVPSEIHATETPAP